MLHTKHSILQMYMYLQVFCFGENPGVLDFDAIKNLRWTRRDIFMHIISFTKTDKNGVFFRLGK